VTTDWIWLDGLPIAQIEESFLADGTHDPSASEITYLISDHLSTPRLGTDVNGEEVWQMRSDAFGQAQITTSGPVVRLRFPGQVDYGYAGIYYNYYRDYDSNTGRYLQSDPVGIRGGLNPFGYAAQNPAVNVDPLGLIEWKGWSTGFSLSTVFGASFYGFELESECNAEGQQALVTVVAVGPTVGVGLAVGSGTLGTLNISDDRTEIDPFIFNGKFALRSIAASTAGFGAAAWQLELGGSHTALRSGGARSVDSGLLLGVDFGVNVTQGSSTVLDVEWRSCLCGN
jgi:RHS repeat-associated protein